MQITQTLVQLTPLRLTYKDNIPSGTGRHDGLEVVPTTPTKLKELNISQTTIDSIIQQQSKTFEGDISILDTYKTIRPYQIEDILFLASRKNAGCFNEQRTGKTPTSLLSFKLKGITKILIICPPSAILQWQQEYIRWFKEPCIALIGTAMQRNKYISEWTHGLVIGYDSLKMKDYYNKEPDGTKVYSHSLGDLTLIAKHKDIEGLILDEAHRIRNHSTKAAEAVFKLSTIPNKLALTGTPTTGKQEEIYSILHFLYPHIFTGYWRFIDYYFEQIPKNIYTKGGVRKTVEISPIKKTQELQEFLNVISTQRKRKEVMPWLPDKEYINLEFECSKEQALYIKELREFFETEHIVTQGILDTLIRERQICLSPALLSLSGDSPKLTWLKLYLNDYPDTPTIIFSKFTSWLEYLSTELNIPYLITGKVSKENRNKLKKDFQEGKINVLLINIDAGKEALTLDRAEVTIFTDKFPPVGDIEQAEDRFVATTEAKANKGHLIYNLIMKDTYEIDIINGLSNKATELDLINNYNKYLNSTKGGDKNVSSKKLS